MIRLDAPDPLRTSSLAFAARAGDSDTVRKLLKEGKRPDSLDNRGWTPLHEAAAGGHLGCVVLLLRGGKCDKNGRTHEGETPLFLSIYPDCNLDIMRLLINRGANVNLGNNEDVTPLHKACQLDLIDCVEVLLESGADINVPDVEGNRPLQDAIYQKHTRIVNMLLKYGADLTVKNSYGINPLMTAAVVGFPEIIRRLDKPGMGLVNERDVTGHSPLMLATQKGCLETMNILLEMGADANYVSDAHQLALNLAAHGDDQRLLECLVKVTDKNKVLPLVRMSPIILAIDSMNLESIKILLDWMGDNQDMHSMLIDIPEEPLNHIYRQTGTIAYLIHYRGEHEHAMTVLHLLLEHGFPVNPSFDYEAPPLAAVTASKAPKETRKAYLELLISLGADADLACPWARLRTLPSCLFFALSLHPDEMWQIRMLLGACKSCDTDRFLRIVLSECLSREERRAPWELLQLLLDIALELGISSQDTMSHLRRICRRVTDFKTQKERDYTALENALVPLIVSIFRRDFVSSNAEGLIDKLDVPAELSPSSLASLCRITVRKNFSKEELKRQRIPNIIHEFLNYDI